MNGKMQWQNLLENRCPKCGSTIFHEDSGVNCTAVGDGCDFFITQERLQQLKAKMQEQADSERWSPESNQRALSDL